MSLLKFILYIALLNVIFPFKAEAISLTPDELVARADEIRSPQLDYTVDVAVTSVSSGGEKKKAGYEVLIKGRDRTIIKTLSPEIDRGRTLLMLGTDLWAFLPDVSKPIRISLQQRLIGDVANGDIARANFSGDYKASFSKTETRESKDYHVLELTAISDKVTYSRVLYWIGKNNYRPYKAEFYAISGRLLKTCFFEGYKTLAGAQRPSRLVLKDPLEKERLSIIEYSNMQVTDLPEKFFSKDYMKKFKY